MVYNRIGNQVTTLRRPSRSSFLVTTRSWPTFMAFQEQVVHSMQLENHGIKVVCHTKNHHKQSSVHITFSIPPGRHCCLWCEVESKNLKLPVSIHGPTPDNPNQRKSSPSRSLETLRKDYERFITRGKGNIKTAKEVPQCHWAVLL